jgi:hypothetical protein
MSDDWKLPPDAWPADEPPEGFAERVMAARSRERAHKPSSPEPPLPPPNRWRRAALAAIVVTGVAATIALFLLTRASGPPPSRLAGGVEALGERRSLNVGPRGVAVAEPGASLDWRVKADGRALVHQTHGNVFYRVERGGLFVVETPAGAVTVLGTCFRVEVDPMNAKMQSAVAAGAGAIVTAAVLVTVYEGKVRVSNAHGQVDVVPGEQASLSEGAAPNRLQPPGPVKVVMGGAVPAELMGPPPADATREQLLARDAKQRERIAALEARVRGIEAGPGEGRDRRRPEHEKMSYDLSQEEWAQMAQSCEVRYDLPPLRLDFKPFPAKATTKLGITEEQLGAVNDMTRRFNDRFIKELRGLYVEATGDTSGVETLEPMAMGHEIEQKSSERDSGDARRRLALERAGKLAPPANLAQTPPIERYYRMLLTAGDQFETELGKIVGADLARDIREDGFGGNRGIVSGCGHDDDEDDLKK